MTEIGLNCFRLLSTIAVLSLLVCLGGCGADPERIEDY
ncbi:MAG: hypothetical protein XD72_1707 [Methanothrix harundinacea]|uniref:Uncharacterized protein n=3 Tax=Methanothrix harundinacea TaxID=301375 RepID=A0A101FSY5_9EURY|nr:MAG: hypothetical protein XD72_1707 [Methanothrix harundinacea]